MKLEGLLLKKDNSPKLITHLQQKPNFCSLGSVIETSRQKRLISFTPEDSIRDLLGFDAETVLETKHIIYLLTQLIYNRSIIFL